MKTSPKEMIERAKSDMKDALAALAAARETYVAGSGKAYAAALSSTAAARLRLEANKEGIKNATQQYQTALAKNNYVVTDAVRNAIFEKNDAEAIGAELDGVVKKLDGAEFEHMARAASDGKAYQVAYNNAHAAYARLKVCEALAGSEDLYRAMALMGTVPDNSGTERLINDEELKEYRIRFIWDWLKNMAAECSEATRRPHVIAIGMLEMGPFADGNFPSPAEVAMKRKKIAEGSED